MQRQAKKNTSRRSYNCKAEEFSFMEVSHMNFSIFLLTEHNVFIQDDELKINI